MRPSAMTRPLGITAGVTDSLVGTFQRRTDEDVPALLANVPQELVHLDPASGVASKPATHQGLGLVSAAHSVEDVQLPLRSQQGGRDEIALGGGLPAISGAVEPSGGDDPIEMGDRFEVGPGGVPDDDHAGQVAPASKSGRHARAGSCSPRGLGPWPLRLKTAWAADRDNTLSRARSAATRSAAAASTAG